jgi:glucose/arabinose dehydrogenase
MPLPVRGHLSDTRGVVKYPFIAAAAVLTAGLARQAPAPVIVQPDLRIERIGVVPQGRPAQMVLGPDGRLYVTISDATDANGPSVVSFAYDPAGTLSDPAVEASTGGAIGIGFGPVSLGAPGAAGSTVTTGMYLTDTAHNGVSNLRVLTRGAQRPYGGTGGTNTVIVQNLPGGYHQADQIIVKGNTLYVGIGVRTSDGLQGHPRAESLRDNAYGGTISQILDLRQVDGRTKDSAGFGLTGDSTSNAVPDASNAGPYTSTAPNKLIVHSSGARNPFGLALDGNGDLWFTNNFSTTQADGTFDGTIDPATHRMKGFDPGDLSLPDKAAPDLKNNPHDQLFKARPRGDYGYNNINWRDDAKKSNPEAASRAAVAAGFFDFATHGVRSTTFDNLVPPRGGFAEYDQSDINHIVGLGPGSSADGFVFYTGSTFPAAYHGQAFITRWTGKTEDSTGHSVDYRDVVAVDVKTGIGRQIARGFGNPLAALEDGHGNVLIADYGTRAIYRIGPGTAAKAAR